MTILFNDTFTGSGQLASHTSDSGATWAMSPYTSGKTSASLILSGGGLIRPSFGSAGSDATGEAAAYLSTVIPAGSIAIETSVTFANVTDSACVFFLEAADTGSAKYICAFGSNDLPDGSHNLVAFNPGGTHNGVSYAVAPATPYILRLEIASSFYTVLVNGVQQVQVALATPSSNAYGIDIYDGAGTQVISLDYLTVQTITGPGAVWTDYVGATETSV